MDFTGTAHGFVGGVHDVLATEGEPTGSDGGGRIQRGDSFTCRKRTTGDYLLTCSVQRKTGH